MVVADDEQPLDVALAEHRRQASQAVDNSSGVSDYGRELALLEHRLGADHYGHCEAMDHGISEQDTDDAAPAAGQALGYEVGGVGELAGRSKDTFSRDLRDPIPSVDRLGRGGQRYARPLCHLGERGRSALLHDISIDTTRRPKGRSSFAARVRKRLLPSSP